MCCLALRHESVMLSPRSTAGNGLFGKNNNTGTYLDRRGCFLVATQSEELINASCFLKIEPCDVDVEGGGSLGKKRARIWSLNVFISCKQTGTNYARNTEE